MAIPPTQIPPMPPPFHPGMGAGTYQPGGHGYVPGYAPNYGPSIPVGQFGGYNAASPGEYGTEWAGTSFSDKAIRKAFIRKVYLILLCQLALTAGIIAVFIFIPEVKFYVMRNIWTYYMAFAIFFGVYLALVCCNDLRRKVPGNFICLTIFTIAMAYMMGVVSSFKNTNMVLMAMGICCVVCFAVILFSIQTRFDFTKLGGILFVFCIILFVFGILTIFTHNKIMNTVYAAFMALLFMGYLAYDTQTLMGNKKYALSPEEYIFGALQLYLDIVYIFMAILSLSSLGSSN
ncbi:unnamed protein product [Gordionus sp. m RMFG-2023]|uniref:protein lifeguard 1-like n=1 Tax=Gordionus sp. m RMFG-2023 TaxID=3053472 RepID=UPI0030DF41B7